MNIQSISKENQEVTVKLSKDDLINICNALYAQSGEEKDNDYFMQLYSDMMMVRDLCQYGHVDDFCLTSIVKCRSKLRGFGTVASIEDRNNLIDSFANNLINKIELKYCNGDLTSQYIGIQTCDWIREITETMKK